MFSPPPQKSMKLMVKELKNHQDHNILSYKTETCCENSSIMEASPYVGARSTLESKYEIP